MLSINKQTRQYIYQVPDCHNKLNQYGKLALQSKQESFQNIYHSRLISSSLGKAKKHEDAGEDILSKLLLDRNSQINQRQVNPELMESFKKLELIGLTTPRELKQVRYEGSSKIPTVYNDYHSRARLQSQLDRGNIPQVIFLFIRLLLHLGIESRNTIIDNPISIINEQMNNIDKVRNAFSKSGFNGGEKLRKTELSQFLNSLMQREKGEAFDQEVVEEIWEQSSNGKTQVSVDEICQTIVQAQNIVQNRLLQLSDQINSLKEQLYSSSQPPSQARAINIEADIDRLNEEKAEYDEDLRLLTEPFGINIIAFMARGVASRRKSRVANPDGPQEKNLDERGNEVQLKWLFILTLALGLIEIIVIYRKYDFLNLIVFTSLLFIFLMNHFDRTYIKANLALLLASEILDSIWLFMNSSDYWDPPGNGTSSGYEKGYLKLIIFLAYLGVFLKIPLGVFLYHYRNVEQHRSYDLDIGILKFSLTPNKINPITHGIHNFSIDN